MKRPRIGFLNAPVGGKPSEHGPVSYALRRRPGHNIIRVRYQSSVAALYHWSRYYGAI